MDLDFSFDESLLELKRTSRGAFEKIISRHSSLNAPARQKAALDEVWNTLADLGFQGFLIPKKLGGNGRGLLAAAVVMEELGAVSLHSFRPILTTMTAAGIDKFGSEELKSDFLPGIAAGEIKTAIAATESRAGFNVFNIDTIAEKKDGDYLIDGSKTYISGVDISDHLILITRTKSLKDCLDQGLSKTYGLSVFIIDKDAEGIEITPVPSRGEGVMTQYALRFNGVYVPDSRLIGEEHQGAKVLFHVFNPERILAAAMAVGISRYCLEKACGHARERRVFKDTPIGAYQSIQHPLADLFILIEAARLLTHRAACLFDREAEIASIAESANSAKYLAAETAMKAVDAAIDAFGGKGFDEDYGIIHLLEAARLLKTSPISNALILNQIAEHSLNLPRSY